MRHLLLLIVLLLHNVSFSQNIADNINFEYYIGDTHVGVRINPVLTSLKGIIPNQEVDLNFILYYQDQYTISNDQILGIIEGRLITETPLSSYDPLEKIRKDKLLAVSNYASQVKEYQEALSNFRLFQQSFDSEVDTEIQQENVEEQYNNEQYYDGDQYYYDDEQYYDSGQYSPNEGEVVSSLQYIKKSMFAQSIDYPISTNTDILSLPSFPSISYTNVNSVDNTLSARELEFLVRYEELRDTYNEAVRLYNQAVLEDQSKYKDYFDPADPAEEFTVVFAGGQQNLVWSKKFGLDGNKSYQSHNDVVWYLGYQLALNKQDLRVLYNIFSNSTSVRYFVKGSNGVVEFNLSPYFIIAVKELIDLYVKGNFVIKDDTSYPMMRNY